jgi:adhesin/invasin
MLKATSSSRTIAYSVSTKVSTPSGGTWLQVSTAQGQTPGTVTITAHPENLSNGVYDGSVLFTPTDNTVNSVAVPVTLIVGCGQGGCQLQPTILALVNGASFQPGGAPRAIMTIFGTNLSDAIYLASSYPLPTQLGPSSVTVNGMAAHLLYASPNQINFQMPSAAPVSTIQVVVSNQATANSRASRASEGHTSALAAVNPGLFVTPDNRASALNGDLSAHTAATPIPAGGFVILFLTGEGSVTPAVPDGTPAPINPLSIIDAPVQVNIGGASAQVTYQGLAPGYAGLAQINVIVPSGLTPGDQPVFITVNGVPSNSGLITVK